MVSVSPRPLALLLTVAGLVACGACAREQGQTSALATALVDRYLREFWEQGNLNAIHDIFAPEITMHYLGRERPLTPAQHEAGARAFRGAFPDLAVVAPNVIAAGDYVVAYTAWTGTHQGPISQLGGRAEEIAPAQRRLQWTVLYMFRIADGRIVEMWEEWNEGGFIERLRQ